MLGRISFSKYEQALEQKNAQDVESKLKEMAQNWTLSLAYNGKYGKGGRDATGWRKVIYNSLSGLNTAEMFWVREGINITYKKFFASEDLKFFESFVNELF